MNENKPFLSANQRKYIKYIAIALFVFVLPQFRAPSGFDAWISTNHTLIEQRSFTAVADSNLWRGLDHYRGRRTKAAIEALGASRASGPYADLRDVYLASALAHEGRFSEALRLIEEEGLKEMPIGRSAPTGISPCTAGDASCTQAGAGLPS